MRPPARHGLARILSKQGVCSRTEAARWVRAGRVRVDGRPVHDPEFPISGDGQHISVDGHPLRAADRVYLVLNKPRGLVTTVRDEKGRETVYRCLEDPRLPWLAPVGRLDKASEGLLLFSNDTAWAAAIADPLRGPHKTYHVQVSGQPGTDLLARLEAGVHDEGEHLSALEARILRTGARNAWLEIVLDEGRNRQIRRLLAAFDLPVLRLVRVAIGPLALGPLPKGAWRLLEPAEVQALGRPAEPEPADRAAS